MFSQSVLRVNSPTDTSSINHVLKQGTLRPVLPNICEPYSVYSSDSRRQPKLPGVRCCALIKCILTHSLGYVSRLLLSSFLEEQTCPRVSSPGLSTNIFLYFSIVWLLNESALPTPPGKRLVQTHFSLCGSPLKPATDPPSMKKTIKDLDNWIKIQN